MTDLIFKEQVVTKDNIEELQYLVIEGPHAVTNNKQAKYIYKNNKKNGFTKWDLRYIKRSIDINIDDKVLILDLSH